jgi:4-amino-4-deoxychorismate lyase
LNDCLHGFKFGHEIGALYDTLLVAGGVGEAGTQRRWQTVILTAHPMARHPTDSCDDPFGFWYDGQLRHQKTLALSIHDPALLYGATVFTTLRIYNSLDHPCTAWSAHCQRLRTGLQSLGWAEPDWQRLRQGAQILGEYYAVLRVTLFPDGREWITGRALPLDLLQQQTQGITAWVADAAWGRSLPAYKTGNYLVPWLALQQAQAHGAQESILIDEAGNWLETSTGNLWGWANGCWYTPALNERILPGLQRQRLLQGLRCHNKKVVETTWDAALVLQFETLAYSNCVVEFIPIQAILTPPKPLRYDASHPNLGDLRQACQVFPRYVNIS